MNRIKRTIVLAVLWNGPTFQHDFWLIIIHHIIFLIFDAELHDDVK